jgi:hypothetical protein
MTMVEMHRYCKGCRGEIAFDDDICPHCKKEIAEVKSYYDMTISEEMRASVELRFKHKNPSLERPKAEGVSREKASGATKRPVKEELTIDRGKNRKIHKVWEKGEDGEWKLVHDEDIPLRPAKRS